MGSLAPRSVRAPYVVAPTWQWDGDDGSWSTFATGVGTPPQSFRILSSTSTSETWLPTPQGCDGILSGIADCGSLRGVNSFNNVSSRGFQSNSSSTWSTFGIHHLTVEHSLFGIDDNGLYGLDTIAVSSAVDGNSSSCASQTIAGITTTDYLLGSLGLGISSANFSTQSENIPSPPEDDEKSECDPKPVFWIHCWGFLL